MISRKIATRLASTFLVILLATASFELAGQEIHAHRGARGLLPENSLAAFEFALRHGAEVLELDLGVTKDNRLVLCHDSCLNPELVIDPAGRRITGEIPLRSLDFRQLRRYDFGALPNPRFPDQKSRPLTRIATLDELFEMVRASPLPAARRVQFNIETKLEPGHPEWTPDPATFASLVVDCVRRHGMVERTIVQSFDHRSLKAVKALDPRIRVSALTSDNLPDYLALARAIGAEVVSPHQHWITAAEVRELQAAGVRVIPWTANTPADWERLLGLGVDGIITDYPDRLALFLRQKGLRK